MQDKKSINVEIGANIKFQRELAGYTQEKFSELIGIGPKSLSAVERGTVGISLTTLRRICEVLSVPSDALVFGECPQNDVQAIAERLQQLTPAQFEIASNVLQNLFAAFALRPLSQDR